MSLEKKRASPEEIELNVDTLVGPTHLFQGLSFGNIASINHEGLVSSPKQAALQGLEKMWLLDKLGVKQAVLPPQKRPHIPFLKQAGFSGSDKEIVTEAFLKAPTLLAIASSSSSMWCANSATVSKQGDTLHITPANLSFMPHRSLEKEETEKYLKLLFEDPKIFIHHPPLPSNLPDEGAANHMRLVFQEKSLDIFVHGRHLLEKLKHLYPARQPLESQEAVARTHEIPNCLFIRQSEEAINAGAFHNDVVATNFETLLLFHEKAFSEKERVLKQILKRAPYANLLEVKEEELPLKEAISTYFFNCQIVRSEKNERVIIAPKECEENKHANNLLKKLLEQNVFDQIYFFSLTESMQNGGGPACLRLRVPLSKKAFAKVNPKFLLTEKLYLDLKKWINTYYREKLTLKEIPEILEESDTAFKELSRIFGCPLE